MHISRELQIYIAGGLISFVISATRKFLSKATISIKTEITLHWPRDWDMQAGQKA